MYKQYFSARRHVWNCSLINRQDEKGEREREREGEGERASFYPLGNLSI